MADIRKKGKIPVGPGQPPADAELMEFTKSDEKWNVYELDDGTQIRMRATAVEVWRIVNAYDNDGNPVYVIKSQNITSVNSPENLKGANK